MHWLSQWFGGKFGCLQCCSSFRGSSSIWGACAWSAAKMASQLPNLHSIPKNDPWNSILIYQTRIFCKKNGSKSSILPEIEVQTFYYPLYAVATACCVPWQIPVRNMREHSREICYFDPESESTINLRTYLCQFSLFFSSHFGLEMSGMYSSTIVFKMISLVWTAAGSKEN